MNWEKTLTALPQEVGGTDNGFYRVQLAMLEFDDIPSDPDHDSSTTASSSGSPATSTGTNKHPNIPVNSSPSIADHADAFVLGILSGYAVCTLAVHVWFHPRVR